MPQVPQSQLATIQISVINESTILTDAEVIPVVAALQKQVTNDFRPAWGVDAELALEEGVDLLVHRRKDVRGGVVQRVVEVEDPHPPRRR